jgi:hypothetical protein
MGFDVTGRERQSDPIKIAALIIATVAMAVAAMMRLKYG